MAPQLTATNGPLATWTQVVDGGVRRTSLPVPRLAQDESGRIVFGDLADQADHIADGEGGSVGSRTRTRSSVRGTLVVHELFPAQSRDTAISGAAIRSPKASVAGDGLFSTIGRQNKEPLSSVVDARASRTPITLDRVGNVTWRRRMARSLADQSWRGCGSRRRDGDDGGKSAARAVRRPVADRCEAHRGSAAVGDLARVPLSRSGSARKSRRWISRMPCPPTCERCGGVANTAPCALKRMATGAGCGRLPPAAGRPDQQQVDLEVQPHQVRRRVIGFVG